MSFNVRLARPSDLRHLQAIEDSGDAQFLDFFGDSIAPALLAPSLTGFVRDAQPGFLLVIGTPPVGFAHVVVREEEAHLEQLSVLPEHQGAGHGRRLVAAAREEARWAGYDVLTLTTYRTVPWNAPFYERLGFVEVERPVGWAAECLARERAVGLDDCDERLVMAVRLTRQLVTSQ